MTYAEIVAKANKAYDNAVSPDSPFDAYFHTFLFWNKYEESGEGIWLFFSTTNSVAKPDGQKMDLEYLEWVALRNQVSRVAIEMGWFQGGNSYRVQ